jgi:hypothetical protein
MARFDWYQATVPAEVGPLRAALEGAALGSHRWESMPKAPQGYRFGDVLHDDCGRVAAVWWGGSHDRPHVVASSDAAVPVSQVLRSTWPEHYVTRADPCMDFAEPGAYERLQGLALDVARERGIKVGTAGDHLVTMKGRTCYLGSPSSHTRLRIYDKAEELRQKFADQPQRLASIPAELARFELQVRPQTRQAKLAAATADPVALMGSAAWSRELLKRVAHLDLPPFEAGKPWRQADDDRAYAALLAQYGGLLGRIVRDLGSWECLGLQLGQDLAELADHRRAGRS